MRKRLNFLLLFPALLAFDFTEAADDGLPKRPEPPKFVNNLSKEFPHFLSASEEHALEQKLEHFSNETSNQIVIVIVDNLAGYEINDFSARIGQKWKAGQEEFDNGIVLTIKPTGGKGERDAYIATGYGLEGIIPDITAKLIVEKEIIPTFQKGNFYEGLNQATNVLMSLAKKEYNSDEYGKRNEEDGFPASALVTIVIALFLIFFIPRRNGYTIGRGGRYYGGGWGGFGGRTFLGGGSGGFGGFGGGGFGGGGAGGRW